MPNFLYKSLAKPSQLRSQKTLDGILTAAKNAIAEKNFEQIKITDICRTAGVTTGAFYARFPEKKDILFPLMEHLKHETNIVVDGFNPSLNSIENDLIGFFNDLILVFRLNAGLIHTLISQAYQHKKIATELRCLNTEVFKKLEAIFSSLNSDWETTAFKQSLQFALLSTLSVLRETIFDELFSSGKKVIPDEFVTKELTNMFCRYLRL